MKKGNAIIMKFITVLTFTAILFGGCLVRGNPKNGPEKTVFPNYDIHLSINPQTREIEVDGSIDLNLSHVSDDTLTFYLDRGMDVSSFTLDGKDVAVLDTSRSDNKFMPKARKIQIDLTACSQEDKLSTIAFSYHGKVSELPEIYPNRIDDQWTEMGLYYAWFPYSFNQLSSFTYNLQVEAPDQYEAFGLGSSEKKNGYTEISNSMPTTDMLVCLSRDIKINSSKIGGNAIKIFYHSFDSTMVQDISARVGGMTGQYNAWFGKKNNDISLIESQRNIGGGYARKGGVVLSDLDGEEFYENIIGHERYFAHEFAHLWWYKANVSSWEDWFNESFAEYSALMIIRKNHGKEAFDELIARKRDALEKDTPPIWGFDRMGGDNTIVHHILYNKGPLILHELEINIGHKQFVEFCNKLIADDISSTPELLTLLEATHGKDVAASFEKMLKTR